MPDNGDLLHSDTVDLQSRDHQFQPVSKMKDGSYEIYFLPPERPWLTLVLTSLYATN